MATFQINCDEEYAMRGLPHVARLVYLYLRQYMDYETGITGIKRKVSLQGISEYLYVEPHQGIKEEKYSHMQVRGALNWLEKAGLIERDKIKNKSNRQSIFKLVLATTDYSDQNKVIRGATDKVIRGTTNLNTSNSNILSAVEDTKADNTNIQKVIIPPLSDINTTHNAREKYPMSLDWVPPDKNILKLLLLNAGLSKDTDITFDVISEYRGFWAGRPDVYKTTHEWTHGLVIQFKNKLQREKANGNSKQAYRQSNDYRSTMERTATDTSWYYGSRDNNG